MNYYVRYFDNEEVLNNVDELINFLSGIFHDDLTQELTDEVVGFCNDKTNFPRHLLLSRQIRKRLRNLRLAVQTEVHFRVMLRLRKSKSLSMTMLFRACMM